MHMNELAPVLNVLVPPDLYERIRKLYEDGLYLQAYRLAETRGPLKTWRGTAARVLAGRMAGNLGSMRLSDWHFIHAWRQDRRNPEAMWFFARYLLSMRGPLAAWRFRRSRSDSARPYVACFSSGLPDAAESCTSTKYR